MIFLVLTKLSYGADEFRLFYFILFHPFVMDDLSEILMGSTFADRRKLNPFFHSVFLFRKNLVV